MVKPSVAFCYSCYSKVSSFINILPQRVWPVGMEQISVKTPNPKCQLFLKIYQWRYLAAGVHLSEAPAPPMTPYKIDQGRYLAAGVYLSEAPSPPVTPYTGAYTATLYVMENTVKGGWACTPPPFQPGLIFPSWWNERQKSAIATLFVLCVCTYTVYIIIVTTPFQCTVCSRLGSSTVLYGLKYLAFR
jgi:hypothetical protein